MTKGKTWCKNVFTTVLNIDQCINERSSVCLDLGSSSVVYNNSTIVYICNRHEDFVGKLIPVNSHKAEITGGRGYVPPETGTLKWRWKDNEGNDHEYMIKNVLYFPQSPTNIYSVSRNFQDSEKIKNVLGLTLRN